MIKINNNYYAKNAILGITSIERVEKDSVFYYRFKIYIDMADNILEEIVQIADGDHNSLGKINHQHNSILSNFDIY